jgi:hypothetical protein
LTRAEYRTKTDLPARPLASLHFAIEQRYIRELWFYYVADCNSTKVPPLLNPIGVITGCGSPNKTFFPKRSRLGSQLEGFSYGEREPFFYEQSSVEKKSIGCICDSLSIVANKSVKKEKRKRGEMEKNKSYDYTFSLFPIFHFSPLLHCAANHHKVACIYAILSDSRIFAQCRKISSNSGENDQPP